MEELPQAAHLQHYLKNVCKNIGIPRDRPRTQGRSTLRSPNSRATRVLSCCFQLPYSSDMILIINYFMEWCSTKKEIAQIMK